LQKQYYLADLGSGTALDAVAYTNAGAESRALARGDLDAAYLDPVEAISAWQASHGDFRIVAGASSAGGRAMVVLVVSGKLLADNSELEGLLKGEIQAAEFLTSSPISARAAIGAELALLGAKLSGRQLNAAFEHVTFGTDLLATSIAGQAQQAAAAGSLKPVSGLSNIYDVTILNELLRSAGLLQVTT
jgi:NitT/TauT family transport system substrate-binding protein